MNNNVERYDLVAHDKLDCRGMTGAAASVADRRLADVPRKLYRVSEAVEWAEDNLDMISVHSAEKVSGAFVSGPQVPQTRYIVVFGRERSVAGSTATVLTYALQSDTPENKGDWWLLATSVCNLAIPSACRQVSAVRFDRNNKVGVAIIQESGSWIVSIPERGE